MYIIQHMKKTKLKYLLMAAAFIMIFYIGQAGSLLSEGIEKAGLGDENKKNQQIIIGYYPAWKSYTGFTPERIDISKLTHVNYAFANISRDYEIEMGYPDKDPENFKKFKDLKKINPDLKVLISVGGWDWSDKFSDMAATEEGRAKFADSCVEFIVKYGLDGVDLDWEYPVGGGMKTNSNRPEDKENFTLLLKELREKLNAQELKDNKDYLLTIAAGASNYYINNTEVQKFHIYLDYVNLMTYDIHGPWDKYSDFNSPLYNNGDESHQYKISIDSSVKAWLNAGLPADKLIVGLPFYGYIYRVSKNVNDGLYQNHDEGEALSYHTLKREYIDNPQYTKHFHAESLVPWLYDGKTFISYDDSHSIGLKAKYIREQNLGGAMIWELSQDWEGELLNSLYEGLHDGSVLPARDYVGHWAQPVIQKWLDMEYITGYPDGTFRPEDFITRAEFVTIVNKALGYEETGEIAFTDVEEESWYYEEVQKAYREGEIIGVSKTRFAPEDYITREQAAIIMARLVNLDGYSKGAGVFTDSIQISSWAREYVGAAAYHNLIKGYEDNTFRPQNNIKRAEAVVLLDRILQ
jgi:chitinase